MRDATTATGHAATIRNHYGADRVIAITQVHGTGYIVTRSCGPVDVATKFVVLKVAFGPHADPFASSVLREYVREHVARKNHDRIAALNIADLEG